MLAIIVFWGTGEHLKQFLFEMQRARGFPSIEWPLPHQELEPLTGGYLEMLSHGLWWARTPSYFLDVMEHVKIQVKPSFSATSSTVPFTV